MFLLLLVQRLPVSVFIRVRPWFDRCFRVNPVGCPLRSLASQRLNILFPWD